MSHATELRISKIREEKSGRKSRVIAEVNDFPIWYETEDAILRAAPEAYASAFLIPGLLHESRLVMEDPINPGWLKGNEILLSVLNQWWGFPRLTPESPEIQDRTIFERPTAASGTAILFSGGVDSFYSLLRGRFAPDRMVFVHGADIPLEDTPRIEVAYRTFLEVASATGVKPVFIKTNLRKHPFMEPRYWMQVHGGVLAGTGHLLSHDVGRFLISSTDPYSVNIPWGSHWRVDELWSSDRLHVIHTGAERNRTHKIREIAFDPLVQRHLRVCLENKSRTGNCSTCEKCLRTMLVLQQCGCLDKFNEVFDLSEPLAKRFDVVKPLMQSMPILIDGYHELLDRGLEPDLDRAVRKFLKRYAVAQKTTRGRVRKLLGPHLTRWLRERIFDD